MKILVDANITAVQDIFQPHGEVIRKEGRLIRQEDLQSADAMIIRSVTQVNRALLEGTPVRFVGTTTIGTDHLDISWLEENGITWASAPGCNADSAAQYTLAVIWLACRRRGLKLANQTAGIIGKGNVGSRVMHLLSTLGVHTVANDPPRADAGETGLVSFDEALEQNIVCLHVPLEHNGPYPTFHLLNGGNLSALQPGALLVNSARGAVVDGEALKKRINEHSLYAALDVWPNEPVVDAGLVSASLVATPHVAGYSNDGKYNGASQVYRAFCNWAGEPEQPVPALPTGNRRLMLTDETDALSQALDAACFVREHDEAMRQLTRLSAQLIPIEFDRLRREYPARRDFHGWCIEGARPDDAARLQQLGFTIGSIHDG